ncbi:MAG: hypothetical protein J7K53_11330 [Bacteroidales bacterium]|nr:hypothetical protein [Bacteroidales bacterium]
MSYKKVILKQIAEWKGLEKAYFQGIDILKKNNRISEIELKQLKAGRNCHNDDLIVFKMKELRKEFDVKTEIEALKKLEDMKKNELIEIAKKFSDAIKKPYNISKKDLIEKIQSLS